MSAFGTPSLEDMPERVRLFPLPGTILLPRAVLNLNIFEPRYLAMVRDAMAGDRIIAMIQPRSEDHSDLYEVGTIGRISEFQETDDGRFLIALTGLRRFRLVEELHIDTPWREAQADYGGFPDDSGNLSALAGVERAHLEEALRQYLSEQNLTTNWESIRTADDEGLVATLCLACPFQAAERQALLEAPGLKERADVLSTLMALATDDSSEWMQ